MDDVVHFVVVVGGVDPGRLWGAIGCVAWPSSTQDQPSFKDLPTRLIDNPPKGPKSQARSACMEADWNTLGCTP